MKRGFTLLELIVVIIIIGVLATLGITQYTRMIEKARGAEARTILGAIRSNSAAIYMQYNGSCSNCSAANVGIGSDYPSTCVGMATHYFSYGITPAATGFTATATRCQGIDGKQPGGTVAAALTLSSNFTSGLDTWSSSGIAY